DQAPGGGVRPGPVGQAGRARPCGLPVRGIAGVPGAQPQQPGPEAAGPGAARRRPPRAGARVRVEGEPVADFGAGDADPGEDGAERRSGPAGCRARFHAARPPVLGRGSVPVRACLHDSTSDRRSRTDHSNATTPAPANSAATRSHPLPYRPASASTPNSGGPTANPAKKPAETSAESWPARPGSARCRTRTIDTAFAATANTPTARAATHTSGR